MSLYTKALKHIDMNRVKVLHEEKIEQKKIDEQVAEYLAEQDEEELRNHNSLCLSNWRNDIEVQGEGLTDLC